MKDEKTSLPEWIIKIQEQSWQIEILIASGLILFLYNLPTVLINFFVDFSESTMPRAEPVILFFGGYIFSRALLLGFIVTLLLRSLWLAFLGINYAFPDGINFGKLSFSDYFRRKIEKSKSIPERIIALERVCSLTYSVTIMVTLLTAGSFLFLAILFFGIYYLAPSVYTQTTGIILLVLVILIMIGILDWLFFGKLKNFPVFSKLYYPVYKLFQWLTLSFVFQKEYLAFISNINRWKVFGLFVVYFFLAFEISLSEMQNSRLTKNMGLPNILNYDERSYLNISTLNKINKYQYENMLEQNDRIITVAIQSDVITDNVIKLFVVYAKKYDETLDSLFTKNGVKKFLRERTLENYYKNDSLIQKALNEFFTVEIDNRSVGTTEWYLHRHYKTGEYGFLTYIPVSNLPKGRHALLVKAKHISNGIMKERVKGIIPFYLN